MRNFRKAALAGATAVALTFGTASVASAAETQPTPPAATQQGPSLSSKIGTALDASKPANGEALFGSSQDLSSQPAWAQLLLAGSVFAGITSFVGLVVGPVYNFFVHGPFAR